MDTLTALQTLSYTNALRPKSMPAIQQRRNKLSNQLWQQIGLVKSQIDHTTFTVKRRITVKDLEGNYRSVERPKRIKPWWFMDHDGTLCVSLFYGSKRIEIVPGKRTIAAKNLSELLKIFTLLKAEVEAGNLDQAIEEASNSLKLSFTRNKATV